MANRPISPVLDNAACEKVIQGTYHGTLAMCHEAAPYAVPMNHAFVNGRFYFHCAVRGRKIDLIRQNPNVVYVIAKYHGSLEEQRTSKRCHGPWESLLAYGTARIIEDNDAKAAAFKAFMSCYGAADFQMTEQARHSTSAIVMDVASMTVRAEMARGKTEYWLWQAVANG
jgi:nitroimidazol reductase NimA-like FMN-containing flavoprotein (pyridoxamine 5'-phosphate oxidase superfamily)